MRRGSGIEFSPLHRPLFLYYVLLGAVVLAAIIIGRLRRLPVGRAWEALREDEIACRSLGINTTNAKLAAFAIGAIFGGIAGAFFTARQGFISPESVNFSESALILAIVVLGGMGSSVGVAIAAIVIIGGTEALRELDFLKQIFGDAIRSDAIPHAAVRLRHGADHHVEAARLHRHARAVGGAQGAQGDRCRAGAGGARMSAPPPPILRVEHLTMRFGGLVAVQDFSFTAERGAITALIGPNGAGKTTVFNCITGFYKPTEGRIALQFGAPALWDELDALTQSGKRGRERRDGALFLLERMPDYLVSQRARVARTFQNIRLFPGMTVLENLIVAQHKPLMRASGWRCSARSACAPIATRSARRSTRRATGSIRSASPSAPTIRPAQLSYGEQRRLEIARAMCTDPVLLCLDEPAAGLNPSESAELGDFLRAIRRRSRDLDAADRARHDRW